jgi:multidrug resistance efflux pump
MEARNRSVGRAVFHTLHLQRRARGSLPENQQESWLDIPRPPRPKRKPYIYTGIAVALILATVGFSQLRPAAPTVEGGSLWTDVVKRGPMLRQVRGTGTLVPEQIRWISALTAGRIERVLVHSGAQVDENTELLELSNPDVQLEALDADRQLTLAQASLASLEASLENGVLSQQGLVSTTHSEFMEARRAMAAAERLSAQDLVSGYELERARDRVQEMTTRYESEKKRLEVMKNTSLSQLELQRAQVERLRAIARFHQNRVASMHVKAGAKGTLQELTLEVGQWVNPGALLCKVAQPERLKAVVRVPETQAKDVAVGQRAVIDTHNGTVPGSVIRVDPTVLNGTVAVDVALEGSLPRGARPDLSVDGTIEIERISETLFVGRPAEGQGGGTVGLFKVEPGRKGAGRVSVQLGRASVNSIEVVQGLAAGDEVILSDMSRWDGVDRVRIKW